MTKNVCMRIDEEVKKKADDLFDELGLSLSAAVTMFLKQSIREGGLPFNPNVYNKETLEAMKEAKDIANDIKAKKYNSFDEILDEIEAEENINV